MRKVFGLSAVLAMALSGLAHAQQTLTPPPPRAAQIEVTPVDTRALQTRVKELEQRVAQQSAMIAALEKRIKNIESRLPNDAGPGVKVPTNSAFGGLGGQ